MEPLGHGVTVLDRVECGFSDLVVSLEPEGSAGRFALAAAPAPVGQGQTPLIACHVTKLAWPGILSSHKAKSYLQRCHIGPEPFARKEPSAAVSAHRFQCAAATHV